MSQELTAIGHGEPSRYRHRDRVSGFASSSGCCFAASNEGPAKSTTMPVDAVIRDRSPARRQTLPSS